MATGQPPTDGTADAATDAGAADVGVGAADVGAEDAGVDEAALNDDPDAAMEPEWVSSLDAGLDANQLHASAQVVHEVYGEGVVVRVSGTGLRSRVVVRFNDGQERDLLVEYARLQVVGGGDDW